MKIRQLRQDENPPMDLLLLADPSRESIADYLERGECYIAENEAGKVIAVYVLLSTRPQTAELVNIAVCEEEQGKGIGKKLLLDAIQRARFKGYKTLEVGTGNSSIGQLAFYQKCGFRITSIDYDFFTRHYEEKIYENGIWCRDMIRLTLDLV
ncbi:GNAT family N-acetyltransferase [Compostibacillus humi]|nr:GNAT family N-acetyltransferase [Compostibacillus humi]